MEPEGLFLGLMALSNETCDEVDQEVDRAAMAERSSLLDIFELIGDGLDCLGLDCAFVKLQPVQCLGVHLPRWESGRFR